MPLQTPPNTPLLPLTLLLSALPSAMALTRQHLQTASSPIATGKPPLALYSLLRLMFLRLLPCPLRRSWSIPLISFTQKQTDPATLLVHILFVCLCIPTISVSSIRYSASTIAPSLKASSITPNSNNVLRQFNMACRLDTDGGARFIVQEVHGDENRQILRGLVGGLLLLGGLSSLIGNWGMILSTI